MGRKHGLCAEELGNLLMGAGGRAVRCNHVLHVAACRAVRRQRADVQSLSAITAARLRKASAHQNDKPLAGMHARCLAPIQVLVCVLRLCPLLCLLLRRRCTCCAADPSRWRRSCPCCWRAPTACGGSTCTTSCTAAAARGSSTGEAVRQPRATAVPAAAGQRARRALGWMGEEGRGASRQRGQGGRALRHHSRQQVHLHQVPVPHTPRGTWTPPCTPSWPVSWWSA